MGQSGTYKRLRSRNTDGASQGMIGGEGRGGRLGRRLVAVAQERKHIEDPAARQMSMKGMSLVTSGGSWR